MALDRLRFPAGYLARLGGHMYTWRPGHRQTGGTATNRAILESSGNRKVAAPQVAMETGEPGNADTWQLGSQAAVTQTEHCKPRHLSHGNRETRGPG